MSFGNWRAAGKANTVKNALVRKAPDRSQGTFAIEVTVTNTTKPTTQWEQAGITWYTGGKPVFKLVKELIDGDLYIIPGKKPMKAQTVQLRLIVTADSWTAQYRPEGKGEFQTAAAGKLRYARPLEKIRLPNHRRATMYYEDASASVTMFYDEDKAKLIEKRNTILNTPVTDFELSVRSRNCLVNMNINTLGDLVQKTETELLSYKNFGETSLIEIKEILRQKGLRLGMGRTDLEPTSPDFEKIWSGVGTETRDNMQKPLSQFELSVRSRRCLESMNVHTVGDLLDKTEGELMAVKNFGQTSLKELKELLGGLGLEIKKA